MNNPTPTILFINRRLIKDFTRKADDVVNAPAFILPAGTVVNGNDSADGFWMNIQISNPTRTLYFTVPYSYLSEATTATPVKSLSELYPETAIKNESFEVNPNMILLIANNSTVDELNYKLGAIQSGQMQTSNNPQMIYYLKKALEFKTGVKSRDEILKSATTVQTTAKTETQQAKAVTEIAQNSASKQINIVALVAAVVLLIIIVKI